VRGSENAKPHHFDHAQGRLYRTERGWMGHPNKLWTAGKLIDPRPSNIIIIHHAIKKPPLLAALFLLQIMV